VVGVDVGPYAPRVLGVEAGPAAQRLGVPQAAVDVHAAREAPVVGERDVAADVAARAGEARPGGREGPGGAGRRPGEDRPGRLVVAVPGPEPADDLVGGVLEAHVVHLEPRGADVRAAGVVERAVVVAADVELQARAGEAGAGRVEPVAIRA